MHHPDNADRSLVSRRARDLPNVVSRAAAERLLQARAAGRPAVQLRGYPVLDPPPHVLSAARKAAADNVAAPGTGTGELKAAIAEKIHRDSGYRPEPSQVIVTTGAMQALNTVFRTVLDPGDEVLYFTPSYFFFGPILLAGGVPVAVPMDFSACGYRIDLERLETYISPRTKILALHSPMNPSGVMFDRVTLAAIAQIALRHDLVILHDESYASIVYDDNTHISPAEMEELRDRLLLVQSVTKFYAMPAWRIGYVVAPPEIARHVGKLQEWETLMVNHVAQAAACAAISGDQAWLAGVPRDFTAARDSLVHAIDTTLSLTTYTPQGGPFLMVRSTDAALDGDSLSRLLFDRLDLVTDSTAFFGDAGAVRLGLGGSEPEIVDVADRIRSADEAVSSLLNEQRTGIGAFSGGSLPSD